MPDLMNEMMAFRDHVVAQSRAPDSEPRPAAGWTTCTECEGQGWLECDWDDDRQDDCDRCGGSGTLCDQCGQHPAEDGATRCMCHY